MAKGKALAGIFLSYARDDASKAQSLAKWLERAGHGVWWDRHIHGGSEYAEEIEAALKQSEIVIVLWSEKASHSAWVRDEAAEGRDSGRLIPLTVDASQPPLGFRQLQSISISGWSGRGNPPNSAAIKEAIAKIARGPVKPAKTDESKHRKPWVLAASIGALLLAVAAAFFLMKSQTAKAGTPVIAVMPFADLSPEGDKAYLAEGVAEAILTGLAKEPGIKVIGRSSARQLNESGAAASDMRRAMGITHVLEGSARSIGDQLRMSVRLIDASDGNQLWAEEYARRLDNIFAVQDEIGRAVAVKLRGSFGPKTQSQPTTNTDAYTLYLAARAKMRDREINSLRQAFALAKQVLAADPNYAPGHAIYAELLELMTYDNYGTMAPDRAKSLGMPHARKAIELAPNAPEGYAALGMILDGEEAIAPLRRAISLDPSRAELRLWLAGAYHLLGRNDEAMKQIRAGAEMEPLWPTIIQAKANVLAASDQFDEAEQVLREYEERGGSQSRATKIRSDIAGFYRGDVSEGIRLARQALQADPKVPLGQQSLAWYYALVGMKDLARSNAAKLPSYTRAYVSGDYESVARAGRTKLAEVWRSPDPDIVIDSLAILRDWPTIARHYDAYPRSLQIVCGDNRGWTLQMGINFALALKAVGRKADSGRFHRCVAENLQRTAKGPLRTPYLNNAGLLSLVAELRALEGRADEALSLLDRASKTGFRTRYGAGLSDFAAFDSLRRDPRYVEIDSRLKEVTAREAQEVRNLR